MPGQYWGERQQRNEESRAWAEHDREPWSAEEVEQLLGFWDGTEETLWEIAELLGRTIEACRQRYYDTIAGRKGGSRGHTITITVEVKGWLVGYCFNCGRHTDVYSDGSVALCDECR